MTIKEIAKKLGISTTTVSNVIHGKNSEVSEDMIRKVQKALVEYRYVPNITARNLAQNQSKIIGVVMRANENKYDNALKDPFVGEFIGGIEKNIRNSGYFMMLYISEDINEIIQRISLWNVDGLILLGILGEEWKEIKKTYHKSTIFIDSYFDKEMKSLVNIGLDDHRGAYEMGKYLISNGHKKIAFFTDNMFGVDRERFKGLKKAMEEEKLSLEIDRDVIFHQLDAPKTERYYDTLCMRCKEYTAIFCASDYYAVNLSNELAKRDIHVPEDISITGFDDNFLARMYRPAITTVRQEPERKAELAVKNLLYMMREEVMEKDYVQFSQLLPTELVIRNSVRNILET